MSIERFANSFATTLASPMLIGDDHAHVSAGAPAALYPGQFRIKIDSELLLVTTTNGTSPWTVTRGIEGTSAAAHAAGTTVKHELTAASLLSATGTFDPRTYGTIQAAIDACVAAGGGVVPLDGAYTITSALTIPSGSVTLRGSGRWTTTITQTTGGADVIVCGSNDVISEMLHISDLSLSGGRYALRLNNCVRSVFERLDLGYPDQPTVGLYTEGQNESLTFRDIYTTGTQNGILTGQVNTGNPVGTGTNFPILQKCLFDQVRVAGITGGAAVVLTAGILDSVQYSSMWNYFHRLLLELNCKDEVAISYSYGNTFDGLTNEGAPDAANTYSVIKMGTTAGKVTLRDLGIEGVAGNANSYKYGIEVADGYAHVDSCVTGIGGAAGTADIYVFGFATIVDTQVTAAANLVYANATAQSRSLTVNLRDASTHPITPIGPASLYNAVGPGPTGSEVQVGGIFRAFSLYLSGSTGGFDRYADGVVQTSAATELWTHGWNTSDVGFRFGNTGPIIYSGANTPEGAITAPVGSLFLRNNGGANTTLYVKESGTGNIGWVAK